MRAFEITVTPMDDLPGIHCLTLQMKLNFEESNADYTPLPMINIASYDDHVYLSGLWVPHTMRKERLGSALMEAAVRWAAATTYGKMPLMLDVHPFGREAPTVATLRKFYEGFGFQRWPHHPTSMVRWPKEDRAEESDDYSWCAACKSFHAKPRDLAHYTMLQCKALPVPVDLTNRMCAHCGGHEFHQRQGRSTVIECNRCGAQCEGGAAPA